jgi:hypothetical protein
MRVRSFIQSEGPLTTLDCIGQLFERVEPEELLFCFAYASFSGCAEFQRRFGDGFWQNNHTSWLFGIDYGRTAPSALKFISAKPNVTVKIANGTTVAAAPGFVPQCDFHMKACFAWNRTAHKYGVMLGSGNFSRNGLSESTACGTLLVAKNEQEFTQVLEQAFNDAKNLWNDGDNLADILEPYQERWSQTIFHVPQIELQSEEPEEAEAESGSEAAPEIIAPNEANYRYFWIDAGYVTRNRGPDRPGNQIDLPRGAHRFFGLQALPNQQRNTPIGDITFVVPAGTVVRALRLGNNLMEKITLPIPEEHGFGAYDGTLIEFERVEGVFKIRTYEPNEYLFAFGRDDSFVLRRMDSGRPFGFRN